MGRIKVLSLDLEGTIVDTNFSYVIWEDSVPKLYAKEKGMDVDTAKAHVMSKYSEIGPERPEWYDIRYWFDFFGFKTDWKTFLETHRDQVKPFPESRETLSRLSRDYSLIIISNSSRDFIDLEIKGFPEYFTHIISAPTDFQTLKFPELFKRVCHDLQVKPEEVVHVGDTERFDYTAPREAGVESYLLDRSKKRTGDHIVHDLQDFERKIRALEKASC